MAWSLEQLQIGTGTSVHAADAVLSVDVSLLRVRTIGLTTSDEGMAEWMVPMDAGKDRFNTPDGHDHIQTEVINVHQI